MPDIPGTSRSQTKFLRSFLQNPAGPPPNQWPSPVILRRWLKKPSSRQALQQLREANRHHAELQLSFAAVHAASALQQSFSDPSSIETQKSTIENSLRVLRLHHVRQRFPIPEPDHDRAPDQAPKDELWTPEEEREVMEALDRARAEGANNALVNP